MKFRYVPQHVSPFRMPPHHDVEQKVIEVVKSCFVLEKKLYEWMEE